MNASTPFLLADGTRAIFIPKTHAERDRHCCPLCDGAGLVKRMTVAHIVRVVSEHYGMDAADLLSDRRARVVSRPRQEAMYLARQLTDQSLPCIGRRFSRDHSTVLHAVRETQKRMDGSVQYEAKIEQLMHQASGS